VATNALRTRIDRAVAPAAPLLAAFRRVSALAEDADPPADPADTESAAAFVDQLRDAIEDAAVAYELGTDEEVEATTRMARTPAGNDCSDICLDIYVNVV
jgi:exocyst complex component 7